MAFCTTKTYYNFETSLGLVGVITVYATVNAIGLVSIFLYLPETERRTLEEIELHFSDNNKRLSDIKIRKNVTAPTGNQGIENQGYE
jgi:hypothetical protein